MVRLKNSHVGGGARRGAMMRYAGMPMAMWALFERSFTQGLSNVLNYDTQTASAIAKKAKPRYRQIIGDLPTFEREDRFKANIISCAMLCAFVLCMPRRPTVDELTSYYESCMTTPAMRWFCRKAGKNKFSDNDMRSQRDTAALRAGDRNPYSWNMEFRPYADGSGYEACFTTCGICALMRELGLFDLVPAMCHLDYTMSELGGASVFVREHTLASGGPYCDCGYRKLL